MSSEIQEIPFKETTGMEAAQIVKAAIRVGDKVYTGWRHAQIMFYLNYNNLCEHVNSEMQGFIDAAGNFFNRYMSQKIVWKHEQMPFGKKLAPDLLSEHLWDEDGTPVNYESNTKEPEKPKLPPVKPYVPVGYKRP